MKELVSIGHKIAFELPGVPPETTVCSGDEMAIEAGAAKEQMGLLMPWVLHGNPYFKSNDVLQNIRTLNSDESPQWETALLSRTASC